MEQFLPLPLESAVVEPLPSGKSKDWLCYPHHKDTKPDLGQQGTTALGFPNKVDGCIIGRPGWDGDLRTEPDVNGAGAAILYNAIQFGGIILDNA